MGEHASDGSAKLNFVLSASFSSEYFKRPSAECKLLLHWANLGVKFIICLFV